MRYVIVCQIKDEALNFHKNLVEELCSKFKVQKQKLPAHFTIKAPFEIDDISEIENITESFSKKYYAYPITIDGLDHFRKDVIFMKVIMSKEAKNIHDLYIDSLLQINNLEWKLHEGKDKIFHCTLLSRRLEKKYKPIWDYVNNFNPKFTGYFDNISIYYWDENKWILYKEYNLLKKS